MSTLASVILRDTLVNRPAASIAGRLFYDTTNAKMQRDNGSTWDDVAETVAGSVATDAIWDAAGDLAVGTGANTAARLAKGADGESLSMVAGAVDWVSPNPWTLRVNESGASFANWANDIAAHWSSNATEFVCNPGTGATGKMRYTSALVGPPLRVDLEVFFDSTGTSEVGGHLFGICLGNSSQPSNGPYGGLKFVSNNPAVNGQAYAEIQGTTAYAGPTSTFALDTWIALSVTFSGATASISKGGTLIWVTPIGQTGGSTTSSLTIVVYESKVKVRNIKAYQLTAPF